MSTRGKWKRPPVEQRFGARYLIDASSGCWNWTGKINAYGYGVIQNGGHWKMAHRVSMEIAIGGAIASDQLVCHSCDNPRCVNPHHLFVGTHADNSQDMVDKGRSTACERNPNSKLTRAQVRAIKADAITPARNLAATYGVCESTIRNYRSGRTWEAA